MANALYPSILTVSSGLMAGFSMSISTVSVPSVLASNDPLPAWRETYNCGKRLALTSIGFSTLSGIKSYLDTGSTDPRYLVVAGLSASVGAWTGIFMAGINNKLFAIEDADKTKSDGRIRKLILEWSGYQWGRTALSIAAFLVDVWIIYS